MASRKTHSPFLPPTVKRPNGQPSGQDQKMIKVLSVRQPWAHLIIHHGKDIENRTWHSNYRGVLFIQAAKTMVKSEYQYAKMWAHNYKLIHAFDFPTISQLQFGGIIGSVNMVDCVNIHKSMWFQGPFGFVLKDQKACEFFKTKGQLGIFEIPAFI